VVHVRLTDGLVVLHLECLKYASDAHGDLQIFNNEGVIVATHARGTWSYACILNENHLGLSSAVRHQPWKPPGD
jgi:hypothetical protein